MASGYTARLGIDIGGTFTDIVLARSASAELGTASAELITEKVLTTPADPAEGILHGLGRLQAAGVDLTEIGEVIHGTTLVSNALIERKGARIGLLTTRGFRDILTFVGRELRYDIYDPNIVYPEPLVPRSLRREVNERIAGDGAVVVDLDRPHAQAVIRDLLASDVEAIAVCLLHSYLNPIHEEILHEVIRQEARDLPVSVSHAVLPQIREYERTSATVINAYTQPIVRRYLRHLRASLGEVGIGGDIYLITSTGGMITVDTAEAFPIQIVESGPAAGTLIAAHVGRERETTGILSFDMGGTTAKSCIVRNNRPLINKSYEVARQRRFKKGSGLPVGVPVIDLFEIGAGGGSIAEIDDLGFLQVGPRSAAADPGPACYGRGGREPTVTDANVVLGLIDPDYFLGGDMKLDLEAALTVIDEKIGRPLGLDVRESAAAINQLVTENMTEAVRVHAVEMNVDVRRFPMIAFGGAGPIHAYGVARRLDLSCVVCPPGAGVLSALGLLIAPLAFEYSRSLIRNMDELDVETASGILKSLEEQGRALLEHAGVSEIVYERSVDMCYVGQGFEVTTPIPCIPATEEDLAGLKSLFDDAYETAYGRRLDGLPAQCVTWSVLASGPVPDGSLEPHVESKSDSAALKGERVVRFPEYGDVDCFIYERSHLDPGATLAGPAVVEARESTAAIPPGMRAEVDAGRNLVLTWVSRS